MYKLDRRIEIKRYSTVKNEFGGLISVQTGAWYKWAEARDRNGLEDNTKQQSQWQYNQIFIMRYETERPTRSNDVIYYENQPYKIISVQIRREGYKSWEYIESAKIDENINSDAPMDTANIKVLNYTATEQTATFSNTILVGKSIFGAFKDGVQYVIITSGTPVNKQILFDDSTGQMTWSVEFEIGEVATILYY
ncbi:Bacteriophage SPP1, head-tail adaptor [uncultured Caudovirales phage]|uniref:Bacteriophage SPP1, head-tail adaptor n=1 Tax=uncultured Caudovirales phage TaxID=2100421 RepID=A0A6J7WK72_9CAUD|nr:Bacteriophage SPP1, head-tail adaptor [uncultured Caudovirales phage]